MHKQCSSDKKRGSFKQQTWNILTALLKPSLYNRDGDTRHLTDAGNVQTPCSPKNTVLMM